VILAGSGKVPHEVGSRCEIRARCWGVRWREKVWLQLLYPLSELLDRDSEDGREVGCAGGGGTRVWLVLGGAVIGGGEGRLMPCWLAGES